MTRGRGLALAALIIVAGAGTWWWTNVRDNSVPAGPEEAPPVSQPVPLTQPPSFETLPLPAPEQPAPPALAAPAPARPPVAPGPLRLPFGAGETATYDVSWLGLGAGLSAGTVEFVVHAAHTPGAAFRFELTAVTAAWVSAFFEARDRFWTVATRDLFPLEHGQELHEGRRRVNRRAVFNREARLVRVGDGLLENPADGVSYALPPTARDPLAAMYFVRSRDWDREPGLRLLVSDLGLDLAVDVRTSHTERVTAEGQSQLARRMTVRMEYTTAKVSTPKATVWLSTDHRRVPLMTEVETEYGVFRMSLTRYVAAAGAPPASPRPR